MRAILYVSLFIIVIILNGCCCCTPPSSDMTEERSQVNTSNTTNDKPEKKMYKLNETFTHGDFSYIFTKITKTQVIVGEYNSERASEGGKFIIVNFTEENLSKETKTLYTDRFSLLDGKGREFRPSSEGNTALAFSSEDKDFLLSEVQPGIKHKSAVVFEVPEDASGLILKIPGGWGEEDVRVKL